MLKLSRNGIGALNAQYRSVLRKCAILNILAAGLISFIPTANAEVYDSATNNRFQYMGMKVAEGDIAYVYGTAGYNIKEVIGEGSAGGSDTHNDAWLRNRGTVYIGYNTSGSTVSSTTVSHKHNIAVLNGYAINGGGVVDNMNNDDGNTALNIYNTNFNDNSATRFLNEFDIKESNKGIAAGGVISNYSENQADITGSTFNENYVMHFYNAAGGAIYNGSNALYGTDIVMGKIQTSGNTFDSNHAGNELMNYSAYIAGQPSQVESKILNVWKNNSNNTITGDMSVTASGGAIHNEGALISNSDSFKNNHAIGITSKGGAIYNDKNQLYKEQGFMFGGEIDLNGKSSFTGNYVGQGTMADGSTAYGTTAYGGAIYNNSIITIAAGNSNNKVYFGYDSSVLGSKGNYAVANGTAAGGAIYNGETGEINAIRYNTEFKKNYVESKLSGDALGGAIANYGSIAMQGGIYEENSAISASNNALGGAIYNGSTGTITMDVAQSSSFNSNTAKQGGAMYNAGIINGSINSGGTVQFTANSADKGGAVYNNNSVSLAVISNGGLTFTKNEAKTGGAIYNNKALNLTGDGAVTFGAIGEGNGNHAISSGDAEGGAIYNAAGSTLSAIKSNYSFTNNYAKSTGSGNALGGAISNHSMVTLQGGTFQANSVTSASGSALGGAIYNANSSTVALDMATNSLFTGNSANQGGAMYNAGTISGSINSGGNLQFTSNIANDKGGALYNANSTGIEVKTNGNLTFTKNEAKTGGAIYNAKTLNLTGTGAITFGASGEGNGNHAISSGNAEGGAIYVAAGSTISAIKSNYSFINNYAKSTGSGNALGGAIANYSKVTLQGGTFQANNTISASGNALGGAIYNANNSTVNLQGGSFQNNSATSSSGSALGGAIYNADSGTVTLALSTNSSFSGNSAKQGGAIYNSDSATISGSINSGGNLQFTSNIAGDKGGALYNANSTDIEVKSNGNLTFTKNEAKTGGAIYNAKTLNLTGAGAVTFGASGAENGNHAISSGNAEGGAIYVASGSTLSAIKSNYSFINNYAKSTGSGNALGGAIANYSAVTLQGGTFQGNKVTSASGSALGGAIYNAAASTVSGSIDSGVNLQFTSNIAGDKGGALYNANSTDIEVKSNGNLTFTKNEAQKGGAIYNAKTLNLSGAGAIVFGASGTDNGNHAISSGDAEGGAIYIAAGSTISAIKSNYSFINNYAKSTGSGNALGGAIANYSTVTLQGGTFQGNSATSASGNALGGAIYNAASSTINGSIDSGVNLQFTGNRAGDKGGALYNANSTSIEVNTNGNLTFTKNEAQKGGAIYNGKTLNLTGAGAIVFGASGTDNGNHAISSGDAEGGAIYIAAGSTISAIKSNYSFINNYAKSTDSGNALGGAIANYSTVTLQGGIFQGNSATSASGNALGGAIYNANNSTLALDIATNTSFSGNSANQGGALYNAGTVNGSINSGTLGFVSNTAQKGGAIYNNNSVSVEAKNGTVLSFTKNEASSQGGAIYNNKTLTLSGAGTIVFGASGEGNGNHAISSGDAEGGAIYNAAGSTLSAIKSNYSFINNYAKSTGSGNALGGAIANYSAVTLQGGTFQDNSAMSVSGNALGGAIYNADSGTATLALSTNSSFSGNSAKQGGALYNAGTVNGSINSGGNLQFTNNSAGDKGGALYNANNTGIDVKTNGNLTFTKNEAKTGGAIYNAKTLNLTGDGAITFGASGAENGNHAISSGDAEGGAIYIAAGSTISAIKSNYSFINNYAKSTGSGNALGGAIANYSTIDLQGGIFQDNSATSVSGSALGGAIYNAGTVNGSINSGENIQFTNNISSDKGGAIYNANITGIEVNTNGNLTFTKNEAQKGGAIYNAKTLNLSGAGAIVFGASGTDNGNHAISSGDAEGGAIYVAAGSTLSPIKSNFSFINNYAKSTDSGNALGGAIANYSTVTLQGGTFQDNSAMSASGNALGGAIYNANNSTLALDIATNTSFSDNSAKQGGALYNAGTVNGSINSGTLGFVSNTAQKGGAIYNNNSVSVEAKNGTVLSFTKNEASSQGGAIYNNKTLNLTGDGTIAFGASGEGNGNHAISGGNAEGGAIYNAAGSTLSAIKSNYSFINNYAKSTGSGNALGGAIANYSTVTLQGGTFQDNSATSVSGNALGGAIYNADSGTTTLALSTNSSFSGNSAKQGGALYNAGTVNGSINSGGNLQFTNNSADDKGGALYNANNTGIDVKTNGNLTFTKNEAKTGGAIYNAKTLNLTGDGAIVFGAGGEGNGNHAISGGDAEGGAIYNAASSTLSAIKSNYSFINNYAKSTGSGNALGGAIANYGTIAMQGGTFQGNSATSASGNALGGAIYNAASSTITLDIATNTSLSGNSAKQGGAIYNAGTISGLISSNAVLEFSGNTASATSGGVKLGNSIYNTSGSTFNVQLKDNAQIHFAVDQSVYNASTTFKITGSNAIPSTLTSNQVATMVDINTSVLLDTTLYSASNSSVYNISRTNLILSSSGYIDSTAINTSAVNDTALRLANNTITLQNGSYMNLNSANDTLTNNDFSVAGTANLRYKNQNGNSSYLANTISNNGTVTYYGYANDSDMYVAKALINAKTLDAASDKLLTNIHIDNLKSKEGNQIVVNLSNPQDDTANSKADIIVIDKEIHNDSGSPTSVVFNDMSNNYISQVYLGEDEKIYFAQTQVSQSIYDFDNTFVTSAKNDNYEIKIGYETNGSVYDWFLYREGMSPEEMGLINLPRASLEQTRSILLPVLHENRPMCNCYQDDCDKSFCRCEDARAKRRLWATPIYRKGSYDKPIETDFSVKGIDFGWDYQAVNSDTFGIFGSYRSGEYENDGKGKKYNSTYGNELDITSIIGGLYYRKYLGSAYMMGAVYGGKLDVDLKTDTDVKATIDGHTIGAKLELGGDIRLTRREILTPSLTATYNYIKFKEAKDVNGKKATFGNISNVELEAALRYEYQFNSEYQLPTTGYIKPSVIQTIASGGKVKVNNKEYTDTLENETLGRIEIGADAELIRNFSLGAFGNYTFGSEYSAWGIGGNIRYVW